MTGGMACAAQSRANCACNVGLGTAQDWHRAKAFAIVQCLCGVPSSIATGYGLCGVPLRSAPTYNSALQNVAFAGADDRATSKEAN